MFGELVMNCSHVNNTKPQPDSTRSKDA